MPLNFYGDTWKVNTYFEDSYFVKAEITKYNKIVQEQHRKASDNCGRFYLLYFSPEFKQLNPRYKTLLVECKYTCGKLTSYGRRRETCAIVCVYDHQEKSQMKNCI